CRQARDVPLAGDVGSQHRRGDRGTVAGLAGRARALRSGPHALAAAVDDAGRPPSAPRPRSRDGRAVKIYVRHVLGSFLALFLLVFLAAVAVFVVIDFAGNSRVWLTRPQTERVEYYLNYLPYIAYLVCPIALLLAAVSSVGGMA